MLKTRNGKEISKIGIGTWTIKKDNMQKEIDALKYYVDMGVNYIDVVLAYDSGETLDVISNFLKKVKREDIFVNAFITHGCKNIEDVETQVKIYLAKLQTNYLDCVTLHSPAVLGFEFEKYVDEILRLKEKYNILNIGYSNLSPKQYEQVKQHMNFFEGLYNLENKINDDNGIIEKCLKYDIAFYAYQPLRRNRTAKQEYSEVVSLAKQYGKSQNQILINWMIKHKKIGVLIKSSNQKHIDENLASLNFDMKKSDYEILDKFRNVEFDKIPFSYVNEEGKIRIDQIPNQPIGVL